MKIITSVILEHFLILYRQYQSFIWRKPPIKWQKGDKGTVVLVYGIVESWIFMRTIGNYVNSLGFRVLVVQEIGRNFVTFEEAKMILEKFFKEKNLQDVYIIGHSKGGLIGKYFLENSSFAGRVKKLITIATPFNGSYMAYTMSPFNGLEFVPGAVALKNLTMQNIYSSKIINLYAKGDNLVIPNKSLHLQGVENIQIPIWGHTNILEAKETLDAIKSVLEKN